MSNTMFSFVVPIYNTEKYLRQCLDSIAAQTESFEAILVNDGSTDGSQNICLEYTQRDDRFHLISQVNAGLSVARNTGVAHAKGEYIVFLDSDDYIASDAVANLKKSVEELDYPEVLATRVVSVYENGPNYDHDSTMIDYFTKNGYTKTSMIRWFFLATDLSGLAQRFVVKRLWLEKEHIQFEPGHLHEDVSWTAILIATANSFGCSDHKWYYYRRGRLGSIMAQIRAKNVLDFLDLLNICQSNEFIKRLASEEYQIMFARMASGLCSLINSLDLKDRENIHTVAGALKKNSYFLSYASQKRQRLFYYIGKIFGFKFALRMRGRMDYKGNSRRKER